MRDRYNGDIAISDLSENNLGVLNAVKWLDDTNSVVCFHYISGSVLFLSLLYYSMPVEVLEPINHAPRPFPIMHLHDSTQQRKLKYGVRILQGDYR